MALLEIALLSFFIILLLSPFVSRYQKSDFYTCKILVSINRHKREQRRRHSILKPIGLTIASQSPAMPLERARDSYQSLIRLSAYAEHRDLNHFSSTADLGYADDGYNDEGRIQQTGSSAADGLEYEGEDASLADTEPTYWQYGEDNWKDYETTAPLMPIRLMESGLDVYGTGRADSEGDRGICFTLFPFCDPWSEHDENDETSLDVEESILMHPPPTTSSTKKPARGIIRKASNYPQVAPGLNAKQRKSFRPQMYRPLSKKSQLPDAKQSKHVRFARTNRTVRICPLQKMTLEERAQTWWSSEEFDSIKRSMMVLIQPSEITHLCKTWLAADTEQKMHSNNNGGNGSSCSGSDAGAGENLSKHDTNHKSWWHKYGDSRRGLEKYASPEEAPQILDSYQEAVYQVLLEQERQRRKCDCWCPFDTTSFEEKQREEAEKIALQYKKYTRWARDLALASGASDADAVRCDFDDAKRKSREYFLLKQIYQNEGRIHAHMPDFMFPNVRGFQATGYLRYSNVSSPVTVPSGDEYEHE